MIKGVIHVHSDFSFDGKHSLAELKGIFSKMGIDFVCLTEHVESIDREKYSNLLEACGNLSDEKFLFIPGLEIEERYMLAIGVYDLDDAMLFKAGDLKSQVKYFTVSAHPKKAITADLYPINAIEIWNVRYDGRRMVNPYAVKYLLANAERINPIVGADFHGISDLFNVSIVLENTALRREEILTRLKAGDYSLLVGGRSAFIPKNASFLFYAKIHLYRTFLALVRLAHKILKRMNITIPASVKNKVKKAL